MASSDGSPGGQRDPLPAPALSHRSGPDRGSSVRRILKRHGMNRLPASQKHQPHGKRRPRYEKPQPGQRLQLDLLLRDEEADGERLIFSYQTAEPAAGYALSSVTMAVCRTAQPPLRLNDYFMDPAR